MLARHRQSTLHRISTHIRLVHLSTNSCSSPHLRQPLQKPRTFSPSTKSNSMQVLASASTAQAPCVSCTNLRHTYSGAQLAPKRAYIATRYFRNARHASPRSLLCTAKMYAHVNAVNVGNSYSPVLDTDEAQADLRFAELLDGQNKILVVSAVAPGSSAEKAGIKVGQQILAISDPVNESQMLSLKSKPSKTSLKRALNMRNYPEVEMEFCADIAGVAKKVIDEAGGGDVFKALEAAQVYTSSQESTSAKRNEDKAEFMSKQTNINTNESRETKRSAGKNKNTFALVSAIGFFIIPLAFVAIAIWSGYLDSLQG